MDANKDQNQRYNDSKLMEVMGAKSLAAAIDASGKGRVVVNSLNPGLCATNLFRHLPWIFRPIATVVVLLLARTAEVGSRCLMAAALSGEETHGKYMSDCAVRADPKLMLGPEGERLTKKTWDELLDVLEEAEPGVTENI